MDDGNGLRMQLAEMRHRTTNILASLAALTRSQARQANTEEARERLSWVLDCILTATQLHRAVGVTTGDGLSLHLREVGQLWARLGAERNVQVQIDTDGAPQVEDGAAMMLALLVQEAITNSLAHAYPDGGPGLIQVRFGRDGDGRLVLTVRDDGVGLPDDESAEPPQLDWVAPTLRDHGNGRALIADLARYAGGKASWHADPLGGTVVRVDVPYVGRQC
ncbi:ATP-binding protein [Wenxinia marina]|uniref:Signal transduction histidine kinase n=1 Tax=Wenxinia marina DSM 24838 TaxID=1123501 RepID=A0A0D0QIC5_9RHOB|nr:sensor histidine kinase [Wenxinia marina]KIQ70793.1 Signal transduction histidine kinase [Wenxinia marina DSM 24838]GGL57240.1 hypothetical protein GCM10011392_09650 [Wenxinia marina]